MLNLCTFWRALLPSLLTSFALLKRNDSFLDNSMMFPLLTSNPSSPSLMMLLGPHGQSYDITGVPYAIASMIDRPNPSKRELQTAIELFAYSIESLSFYGYKLKNITLDLHSLNDEDNVLTEYEKKFIKKGVRICKLEANGRILSHGNNVQRQSRAFPLIDCNISG